MDVITLGESMVLFAPATSGPLRHVETFHRHIAGAESNVAIGLARLGHQVGWISRLGDDEFGRYILNSVRGEGVDVSQVRFDPEAPTGIVFKERRELGPVSVIYYRRGSAASRMRPEDLDAAYFSRARYLHLTGITPALSESCRATVERAIDMARNAGVGVSFDPNIRLKLWDRDTARRTLRALIARAHLVLPGADEAELLTGESDPERAAADLLALGPEMVVVKLGAKGSLALTAGGQQSRAPGVALERVVDPVGAGDGFAAGFLAGLLRGYDLENALMLGNTVGAHATTVFGDTEGLPTWAELEQLRGGADVSR